MLNVGAPELLVILVVALLVLGPERLPAAARQLGKVLGDLRRMSAGFQAELRDAIDDDDRTTSSGRKRLGDPPPLAPTPSGDGRPAPFPEDPGAEPATDPEGAGTGPGDDGSGRRTERFPEDPAGPHDTTATPPAGTGATAPPDGAAARPTRARPAGWDDDPGEPGDPGDAGRPPSPA